MVTDPVPDHVGEGWGIRCGSFRRKRSPGRKDRTVLHLHPTRERRPSLPSLSRYAGSAARDGHDLQARLHPLLRQLDASRRCGARSRQSAESRRVHDCARKHEDPCRGRHPASGTGTRYHAGRRSDGSLKNGWWPVRTGLATFIVLVAAACTSPAPAPPPAAAPSAQASASSTTANALRSWNDRAAKRTIVDFVSRVTKEGGSDFVPVPERIATFDNDGTLWAEKPVPFQLLFAFDRVKTLAPQHPEWKTKEPFASLLKGNMAGVAASGEKGVFQIMAATHTGMTTEDFSHAVQDWITTAKHPQTGRVVAEMGC